MNLPGKSETSPDQQKEYITNLWTGIYKTTRTFITAFYSSTVDRNVNVVSAEFLYRFYALEAKLSKESLLHFLNTQ
jgi:hypothetical protein